MIMPFIMLASVIGLIPAFGMLDPNRSSGVVSAVLAIALIALSVAMPIPSLPRFTRLLRPVLIVILVVPALWMLVQVLPMPVRGLANPIWASASAALHQAFAGAITIDIGATLLAVTQYFALVAAALVTVAVALDRQRAENLLYILLAIVTLVAARQIALDLTSSPQDHLGWSGDEAAEAAVFAVTGMILSCATVLHAIDRLHRSGKLRRSSKAIIIPLSAATVTSVTCAAALLLRADTGTIVAALLGAAILGTIFAIRRWLLGPWGKAGLAATVAVGLFGALAAVPIKKDVDLTIAWSPQTQTATERMLSDVPRAGSGAGTFDSLLPVYRDLGSLTSAEAPTAAAAVTIDMGRFFFLCLVVGVLSGTWLLFSRALGRGHDYVYAGAGAAALPALLVLAFLNDGILNLGASLLIAVLCGLALAQSYGSRRHFGSLELETFPTESDEPGVVVQKTPTRLDYRRSQMALAAFGVVLAMQAAWILIPERFAPKELALAADQNSAAGGVARENTTTAASIAMVRGDLWATTAMAHLPRPWTGPNAPPEAGGVPGQVLEALNRAARYAPHRGDVWLALALLAHRYKPDGYDPGALLKMSYYTAPNELSLLSTRLQLAVASKSATDDPELQDMIRRDISLVLTRAPGLRPSLLAAYKAASPEQKLTAERLIAEVDPLYLKTIRTQFP